jgi:branched-chain amino acid transport system permease protein
MKRFNLWSGRVPWALIIFLIALWLPWIGTRYDTLIGTQILIYALFASSLNLLLGVTGLVSFGHVAYFGLGAYICALLMKSLHWPFFLAFPAAGLGAGAFALVFGFFCVRLTKIYFAMLTLAFSQIVWAICFKWNDVTGGDQGLQDVPFPDLAWMSALPGFGHFRIGEQFYFLVLVLVMLCIAALRRLERSPFGRVLTTIRENPERAAFVGVNVRAYELAAFTAAGIFGGFSGALFGIFNRGVYADFVFWSKSADVMIMTILGGMNHFWGPMVGAAVLTILNQQITSYTEYWPLVLGTILVVLLFAFPGGIVGALDDALTMPPQYGEFLFSFRGRVSRRQYWRKWWVPSSVLTLVVGVLATSVGWVGLALAFVYLVLLLWAGTAVLVKRLHDCNRSGWLVLAIYAVSLLIQYALGEYRVSLVVLLTLLVAQVAPFIVVGFLRSTSGDNRFGPVSLSSIAAAA